MKSNEPTRGAAESTNSWTASPRLAAAVRVAIFVGPFAASLAAVMIFGSLLWRPDGFRGLLVWVIQAMAVGFVVSSVTDRAMRRFLPLAGLLRLTLVFPDEAPSRFGTALRSGTMQKRRQRIKELADNGLSEDTNQAATEAVELVGLLTSHDPRTRGHTERVRAYSDLIATEMGIDQEGRDRLAWSVMLHDLGKLTVPEEILNKQSKLEADEWELLKGHPAAGQKMLAPLNEWLGEWDGAAGEHHERWDGAGYPLGLQGVEISLAGRITAVADAYDVITSIRSYKSPMTAEAARRELVRCSGTQFDPEVVRAMLTVSLSRRRRAGPFAWLAEAPRLLDAVQTVAVAPAAAIVAVGAVTLGTLQSLTPVAVVAPAEVAFSTDSTIELTTTSTVAPATTSATTPTTTSTTTSTTAAPTSSTSTTSAPRTTSGPVRTTAAPRSTATTAYREVLATTIAPATPRPPTTLAPTTTTAPTTTAPTTTTTTTTTTTVLVGPIARNDAVTVDEHHSVNIKVLDNDRDRFDPIDESTLSIVRAPQHAESYRVHNDHIHYKSVADYGGRDTIIYSICDTGGECSTATVIITVTNG